MIGPVVVAIPTCIAVILVPEIAVFTRVLLVVLLVVLPVLAAVNVVVIVVVSVVVVGVRVCFVDKWGYVVPVRITTSTRTPKSALETSPT